MLLSSYSVDRGVRPRSAAGMRLPVLALHLLDSAVPRGVFFSFVTGQPYDPGADNTTRNKHENQVNGRHRSLRSPQTGGGEACCHTHASNYWSVLLSKPCSVCTRTYTLPPRERARAVRADTYTACAVDVGAARAPEAAAAAVGAVERSGILLGAHFNLSPRLTRSVRDVSRTRRRQRKRTYASRDPRGRAGRGSRSGGAEPGGGVHAQQLAFGIKVGLECGLNETWPLFFLKVNLCAPSIWFAQK
jgi:hypothetical protein